MLTVNGPVAATASRQGVTQLPPPGVLACAPGGSDSTASDAPAGALLLPPPRLGRSKLGIHDEHAAKLRLQAATAMTRRILSIPTKRGPTRILLTTIRFHRMVGNPRTTSGAIAPHRLLASALTAIPRVPVIKHCIRPRTVRTKCSEIRPQRR